MQDAILKLVYGIESLYPGKLAQAYPAIMQKIITLWETPMMEAYFQEIMVDERGGRQGFTPDVAAEIYYLSKVFEGTRNLPKTRDDNLLGHVNEKPAFGNDFDGSQSGRFTKYNELEFVSVRTSDNDNLWNNIAPEKQRAVISKGYPCTLSGFMEAVGVGDVGAISLFLDCKINIDTRDERRWTALTIAAFNGREALTSMLIRQGANVLVKDVRGYSPIHWAAYNGHANIIKLLIVNGADVNAASQQGWTPLIAAAMNGHLSACGALIAGGANINSSTSDGWSALQKACSHKRHDVVKLLLSLMKVDLSRIKPNKAARQTLNTNTKDPMSDTRLMLTLSI
ncbi:MAG: ankyrin repeat domain-containing protein [Sideroxyarcus sp.]|nr:ankyrin repeat domain-containing protein [Sideroxyarcus sp.]